MGIKPIKTKADYRAVLKEIETLMAAKHLTPEGERLDVALTRRFTALALEQTFEYGQIRA